MELLAKFKYSNVRKRIIMPLGETETQVGRTLHAVPAGIVARAEG